MFFFCYYFLDNFWSGVFEFGVKYYVMVKVCNCVGLCFLKFLNGVIMDNIFLVIGLIYIGFSGYYEFFLFYKYVWFCL